MKNLKYQGKKGNQNSPLIQEEHLFTSLKLYHKIIQSSVCSIYWQGNSCISVSVTWSYTLIVTTLLAQNENYDYFYSKINC